MSIDLEKSQVRVSWRYAFPRETVFRAIAAGRLLATCGSRMHEFRHDFRVGGAYSFSWAPGKACCGEYLEIVPGERVRWTWSDCEAGSAAPSEVTATLTTKGAYTYVEILHERAPSAERAHSYHQGWTEVLPLLNDALDGTTLLVTHDFAAPVERVWQALERGRLFRFTGTSEADFARGEHDFRVGGRYAFAVGDDDYVRGTYLQIVPGEIVRFSWSTRACGVAVEDTEVAIFLERRPQGTTRLHLLHDGLTPLAVSKAHDEGWQDTLQSLAGALQ